MKTTKDQAPEDALFTQAKESLLNDMQARGLGAIIWDISTAGFHQIPEIVHVSAKDGKERVARIQGLYAYDGDLYLIEEDRAHVSIDSFYNHDTEVKPTVVTLTKDMAKESLGDPLDAKGYTTQGSLEEWTVIADCYFEALAEA
mgnify:FL=1|jgi:hypothetical protein